LIEEGLVGGVEVLERGQLQHALDLLFEHHRQDEDVSWRRRAEAGADLNVLGWHVVEQDLVALQGALTDESLAEFDALGAGGALAIRVAGQELEFGLLAGGVQDVEYPVLRRDHRSQLGEDQAADGEQIALAL